MNSRMNRLLAAFLILAGSAIYAQEDSTSVAREFLDRFTMPVLQGGYIDHVTDEIEDGMFVQTSVEYKANNGLFLRVNFDAFDSKYDLQLAEGNIKNNISFSEFLYGGGYRIFEGKNILYASLQTGERSFDYPLIAVNEGFAQVEFIETGVKVNRYSLGFEHELEEFLYFTFEVFGNQVLDQDYFWTENQWAWGANIGLSVLLL